MPGTSAASYHSIVTIVSDLDCARQLIFAADEIAAKELLLSLGEQIEEFDRDDLLLEVYAQLGEIYLVRTAYDGVEVCLPTAWPSTSRSGLVPIPSWPHGLRCPTPTSTT
ncbi:MAG: hypothetical protein QOI29_4266 [Mycobacterium sp.]|nr:hypothetical protein [Mycobacterium sp.]